MSDDRRNDDTPAESPMARRMMRSESEMDVRLTPGRDPLEPAPGTFEREPLTSPRERTYANLAAESVEARRQTNVQLAEINARLSLMPKAGESPRGYRLLIGAVVGLAAGESVLLGLVLWLASEIAKLAPR